MLTKMLTATAALSMLACGGSALAAQAKASAQLGPKQPIPYSQLDAYAKASPKAQASKDWWTGSTSASTGMSTDTSATAPAMSSAPDTAVNPAPSAAPPSLPMTPPTNAPMTEDKMTQPGAATAPPMSPPVDPK